MTGQLSTPPHDTASSTPASPSVGQPLFYATFQPVMPWLRIGPAWAVIAGALSLPVGEWDGAVVLRVLAALLLADPIWGTFWHSPALTAPAATPPATRDAERGPLPFTAADSPAARLTAWLQREPTGAVAGWPVALLLALVLSLALGPPALGLTVVVIGLGLLRLVWTHHGRPAPALLDASLAVGLPWLVGVTVVVPLSPPAVLLAAAFALLMWGVLRFAQGRPHARAGIILGQAALLALLVGQGRPLAAGLVAACCLAPWWLLAWSPGTPAGSRALRAIQPWLLAALLLSAGIRS